MGTAVIEESWFKLLEYNVNYTNSWFQYTLENLLTGKYAIKRKPWKPNKYGCYFCVDTDGCTIKEEWSDDCITDVLCYKLGNCYRTYKEAEKNKDKWVVFYASDEVMEV